MQGDEYLAFERLHQLQHQMEQQHQLTHQRKQYLNCLQRIFMKPWHYLHRSRD
jgi:hypothetical protein